MIYASPFKIMTFLHAPLVAVVHHVGVKVLVGGYGPAVQRGQEGIETLR